MSALRRAAIADARRWGTYRLIQRADGTFNKVPNLPTNRPDLWTDLDAARRASRGRLGVGLAFLLGDGWSGVDVDAVPLDPDYTALLVDAAGDAYVEASVAGAGLHIIGRGPHVGAEVDFRSGRTPKAIWDNGRFLAMTLNGRGNPDADISALVDGLRALKATTSGPGAEAPRAGFEHAEKYTDDDLLAFAVNSPNGQKFFELFRGEWQDRYPSQSDADLALAAILAFWTNGDTERIDRIFRSSALYRDKWERRDYRERTLRKAMTA